MPSRPARTAVPVLRLLPLLPLPRLLFVPSVPLALVSAAVSAVLLAAGAATASAAQSAGVPASSHSVVAIPVTAPAAPPALAAGDRLTIEVSDAGDGQNGTFELVCNAEGGTTYGGDHPQARAACERLATFAAGGDNPFTPTSRRSLCTMQYGGPATAHVTGLWRGHSVDSRFSRGNGCAIARWNAAVPILPDLGAAS